VCALVLCVVDFLFLFASFCATLQPKYLDVCFCLLLHKVAVELHKTIVLTEFMPDRFLLILVVIILSFEAFVVSNGGSGVAMTTAAAGCQRWLERTAAG
jgi:hypothetical protein